MLFVFHWILLLASTFLCFILQGYLICILFNKKVTVNRILLFAIINALMREVPMLFTQYSSVISTITYYVTMFLTITFILNFRYIHTLFSICILIFVSTSIDAIDTSITKLLFQNNFDISKWLNSFEYSAIMRNVANLTLFIVFIIIYIFRMRIEIPKDISKKKYLIILINIILISIYLSFNVIIFEYSIYKMPGGMLTFNCVLIITLLAINIYTSIRSSELVILKQEMQMQKLYSTSLNDTIDKLRGFKHDFNNIVQVIGGYLALNDLNGLKKYHSQMQSECRFISNTIPLNSYVIENPAIYGLLLSKISYSEVNDIQLVLNITCKLDIQNIKIYDFCKVLGILLDNALEAAKESEKKYVELTVNKTNDDKKIIMTIMNSYKGNVDVNKIYEIGFTTKSEHSGFGLWEVNKIISRYSNFTINTSLDPLFFTQKLDIAD